MKPPRPTVASVSSAIALSLLVIAACSGGSNKRLIPPPPATVARLTTAPPGSDFSGVSINPVEGRNPTPSVAVIGGGASMSGFISGPGGPVAGATIRLERFVGDAVGHIDVISNADGSWRAPQVSAPTTAPFVPATVFGQLPTITVPTTFRPAPVTSGVGPQGLLGGRYRVRAWRSPDFALTTPQIFFLEGNQNKQLGLQLSRYTGTSASSVSSPDPPILDTVTNVTAVVTTVAVDADGIVRSAPLAGASVSLTVGAGWLYAGGPSLTNGAGRASFQLRCLALGQSPVALTVNNGQAFSLPIRACVLPPPSTTTSLPIGGSTTSSIPGARTTVSVGPRPT